MKFNLKLQSLLASVQLIKNLKSKMLKIKSTKSMKIKSLNFLS